MELPRGWQASQHLLGKHAQPCERRTFTLLSFWLVTALAVQVLLNKLLALFNLPLSYTISSMMYSGNQVSFQVWGPAMKNIKYIPPAQLGMLHKPTQQQQNILSNEQHTRAQKCDSIWKMVSTEVFPPKFSVSQQKAILYNLQHQ